MKILIAQQDPSSRRSLESAISKWGYQVVSVPDGSSAWAVLQQENAPKVALLDSDLPGMDGLEICRQSRRRSTGDSTYFVLMLEKYAQPAVLEGLAAGADDFLSKPVQPEALLARLRLGRRVLDLQTELRRVQAAVGYQTTHDPLTGLSNRHAVFDTLQREVARVKREGTPLAVFLLEIDQFKWINDTYGTAVGDAVLREVTRRLRSAVRPYDSVGRYSGEGFLLVAPGCDAKGAAAQAQRIRTCVSGELINVAEWGKFKDREKGLLTPILNMGVAAGKTVRDAEALLKAAEAALVGARKNQATRLEIAPESEFA